MLNPQEGGGLGSIRKRHKPCLQERPFTFLQRQPNTLTQTASSKRQTPLTQDGLETQTLIGAPPQDPRPQPFGSISSGLQQLSFWPEGPSVSFWPFGWPAKERPPNPE